MIATGVKNIIENVDLEKMDTSTSEIIKSPESLEEKLPANILDDTSAVCHYCDKGFASISKLKTHYKDFHNVDTLEDFDDYMVDNDGENVDSGIINVKFSKPEHTKSTEVKIELLTPQKTEQNINKYIGMSQCKNLLGKEQDSDEDAGSEIINVKFSKSYKRIFLWTWIKMTTR